MEYILVIGLVQCFFAGLMIATKKPQQLPDRFLAAWLFIMAVELASYMARFKLREWGWTILTMNPFPFAYGPLLLLYVQSLTFEKFRLKWTHFLHFIPIVIFVTLAGIYFNKPVIKYDLTGFLEFDSYTWLRVIYGILFFISISIYTVFIFILIIRHQKKIQDLFSYKSERNTLQWLKVIAISYTVAYGMMFVTGALAVLIYVKMIEPYLFYFSGLTLIAFVVSFYGFKQPAIFNEKFREYSMYEKFPEPDNGPYARSSLSEKDLESISGKLIETFRVNKPYINSDLTLQDVATLIDVPRHHLTQVLNTRLRKNFYLFVNEYRVEEVKKRMQDKKYKHYSILAIAFDSGFNSKSAFNNIFKNITGMTPSNYLASISS